MIVVCAGTNPLKTFLMGNTKMNKWKEIGISRGMDYCLFSRLSEDGVILYNTLPATMGGRPTGTGGYFDYRAIEKLIGVTFILYPEW